MEWKGENWQQLGELEQVLLVINSVSLSLIFDHPPLKIISKYVSTQPQHRAAVSIKRIQCQWHVCSSTPIDVSAAASPVRHRDSNQQQKIATTTHTPCSVIHRSAHTSCAAGVCQGHAYASPQLMGSHHRIMLGRGG